MLFPESLYTIDILFVVFVLFFAVRGTKHGLSGELAHVVTLLALLASFFLFYPQLIKLAEDYWNVLPPAVVRAAVPVLLLLAAVLLFALTRMLFKQALESKLDGSADKISGGLAGGLRGILLGLAVLAGISLIPNESLYRAISDESLVGAWVCNTLTPWVQPRIKEMPVLKDRMSERLDDITR